MFKFLKDKLKSWTEKLSKKAEEESKQEELEEKEGVVETSKPVKDKTKKEGKEFKGVENLKPRKPKKQLEEERKIGKAVYEDIEKENEIERKEKIEKEKKKELENIKEEIGEFEEGLEKAAEPVEEFKKIKPEKKGFFASIKERIATVEISQEEFNEQFEELEVALIENNVALEAVDFLRKKLENKIVGEKLLKKEIEGIVKETLKDSLYEMLNQPFDLLERIRLADSPYVILFFGINGSGKTTTIAKVADYLKRNKITSVLAAGDTFRAASIEQLKEHGKKLGIHVISHEYNSDPASVGFDAVSYAKKHNIQAVLIDTAGRMHTNKDLLREMEKINKVTKPNLKIFIGESITGNDAVEQARQFNDAVGIDGSILTKADIDEKGGTIISISYITQKPILFLGTGQEYDKLEKFDRNKFIEKLGL